MVAVVSGNGLGLFNTSINTLGSSGKFGQGNLGQAGGQSYVNVANGNLILQFQDEQLSGAGFDVAAIRTYNAQGAFADGDGDNWRWNGERKVSYSGPINTVGSSVTRTAGDGHSTVYMWNASKNRYDSGEGDGANDSIVCTGTEQWVWTDGNTHYTEYYSGGRIASQTDVYGNTISFVYDSGTGRLISLTDNGTQQKIVFTYGAVPANASLTRLQKIDTYSLGNDANGRATMTLGSMVKQVSYGYDNLGRLTSVTTDLTPGIDNSVTDGKVYTTNYTYDGTSFRIASLGQSDGTSVSFTYQPDGKIKTVTDANGVQTFAYSANSTTVTNGLNQIWIYTYDANGQLTKVQSPAINGQVLSSSYQYNANGDVTQVTDGLNNSIVYQYDDNGNRILERDALGNTVTRIFNANNFVLSETHYRTPDPDADGPNQSADPETTRYVYVSNDIHNPDSNRLRFVISAEGRVTEYRYTSVVATGISVVGLVDRAIAYTGGFYNVSALAPNAAITEAQVTTWVAAQDKTKIQLTQNQYDYRGNLSQSIQYASINTDGTPGPDYSVAKQYTYNEYGQLIQVVKLNGPLNSKRTGYGTIFSAVYDGLGRQQSIANENGTTTTVYDGVNKKITVANAAGLISVSNYDVAGRLLNITQTATHTNGHPTDVITRYFYDAAGNLIMTQNASGDRSYNFYDAAGRLQYFIDATGAVTENVYDNDSRIISKIQYNKLSNTTNWFNGTNVVKVTLTKGASGTDILTDAVNDRSANYIYDDAGHLCFSIDALNTVTENIYDGTNRLIKVIQHATSISGVAFNVDALNTWSASTLNADDRAIRYFYDKDNNQIGVLDAEGYLSEKIYDAAGQLGSTIQYANITAVGIRTTGSFTDLKNGLASLSDLRGYLAYDAAGRVIASLDEKGFLTETVYDTTNRKELTLKYVTSVVPVLGDTIASIRARAGASETISTISRDSFGRIISQISVDGTTTQYNYDGAGRLYQTVIGNDQTETDGTTSRRGSYKLFDDFGNVTGIATGEGEAHVGHEPTSTENIIGAYGVLNSYDVMGNLITQKDQNGNKTYYFYDADNRLTHTVDMAGNVTETQYNAFGQISATIQYNKPISTQGLIGGRTTAAFLTSIAAIATPSADRVIKNKYNKLGFLLSKTDAEGFARTYNYTSFGQLDTVANTISVGVTVTNKYEYNHRGEQTKTTQDTAGLAIVTRTEYDAFGRITNSYDGLNKNTHYQYDSGGRIVTVTDALNHTNKTEYDAFGRVLNYYDADNQVTKYVYDDINRTLTVTTPENISVTTYKTRYGETLKIIDGKNNTSVQYSYNKNGQLTKVTDALNQVISQTKYDSADRVYETTDARGVITHYEYDVLNHVFRKTIDPAGLNIKTKYEYDAFGLQLRVTRGEGLAEQEITEYTYDRKGQLKTITIDPTGLALRTTYTYDGIGNNLTVSRGTVTSPSLQVVSYQYDKLNRRISEIVDPASLKITTQYKYDNNGNLTRKIDPNNHSTWYVYNDVNQKIYTINAEGAVVKNDYDNNGRVYKITAYVNKADTTNLGDVVSSVDVKTDTKDQQQYFIYDKDGRERYRLRYVDNNNWAIEKNVHDANNNIIETRQYDKYLTNTRVKSITANGSITIDELVMELVSLGYNSGSVLPHSTHYAYDKNNRLHFTIDAANYITENIYDSAGNLVLQRLFNTQFTNITNYNESNIETLVAPKRADVKNHVTVNYFDTNNRKSYVVDGEGYVTKFEYDALGNLKKQTLFANAVALPVNAGVVPTVVLSANKDQITQYQYDTNNRLIQKTNAEGYITKYSYDALGNTVQTDRAIDKDATKFASTYSYFDKANRERYTISAENHLTEKRYDVAGNLLYSIVYDEKVVVTAAGTNPVPVIPGKYHLTGYLYNNVNQVARETNALSIKTDYEYDAFGNRISLTEAVGTVDERTITYTYDAANRLIDTVKPIDADKSIKTHLEYDEYGNISKRYDAYGTSEQRTTSYFYDNRNFLWRTQDPRLVSTVKSFDCSGNVTFEKISGLGVNEDTFYEYDRNNRVINTTDAEGGITRYTYDAAGNQASVINANLDPLLNAASLSDPYMSFYYMDLQHRLGVQQSFNLSPADRALLTARCTISYTYDKNNRLASATDAMGTVTQYTYDGAGNKLSALQAAGNAKEQRTTKYDYDKENHLITVTDPKQYVTKYEYDVLGNQIKITDANNVIRVNTYDLAGKLKTSTSDCDSNGVASTISIKTTNVYDNRGNLKTVTQAFANGTDPRVTSYTYDLLDRQITITDAEGFSTKTVYDAFGNQTSVTKGLYLLQAGQVGYDASKAAKASSIKTEFTYTNGNQILTMTDGVTNITTYTYDGSGNRLTETLASNTKARTTTYKYGELNQVIEVDAADGGCTIYTYDKLGNKINEKILQSGVAKTGKNYFYTITANDQLDWGYLANKLYGSADVADQFRAQQNSPVLAVGLTLSPLPAEFDTSYQAVVTVNPYYIIPANPNGGALTWENIALDLYGVSTPDIVAILQGQLRNGQPFKAGSRLTYLSDPVLEVVHHESEPYYIVKSDDTTWEAIAQKLYGNSNSDVVTYLKDRYGSNVPSPGSRLLNVEKRPKILKANFDLGTSSYFYVDLRPDVLDTSKWDTWIEHPIDKSKLKTTDLKTFIVPHLLSMNDVAANKWIITKFEYDSNRNLTASINSNDIRTEHDYDTRGNLIETRYAADTDEQRKVRSDYDANNRKTADYDGYNRKTSYEYDGLGNRIKVTDAVGAISRYYYDDNNRLVSVFDPEQYINTFKYDSAGNRTEEYVYMTKYAGNLDEATLSVSPIPTVDSLHDRVVKTTYDKVNQILTRTDADGSLSRFVYNSSGNVLKKTEFANAAKPRVTDYQYYADGRLDTATDNTDAADITVTKNTYDGAGNLVTQITTNTRTSNIDPNPIRKTVFDYDLNNRVITQEFYDGTQNILLSARHTGYDLAGNVVMTDVAMSGTHNQVRSFEYDLTNLLIKETDGLGKFATYGYDKAGNRTSVTDRDLSVTNYVYDLNNRQTDIIQPEMTAHTLGVKDDITVRPVTRTSYDAVGNIIQITDPRAFSYNSDGTVNTNIAPQGYTTTRFYDNNHRVRIEVKYLSGTGSSTQSSYTRYEYDASGNVSKKIEYSKKLAGVVLSGNNREPAAPPIDNPDQKRETRYEYDFAGRLVRTYLPRVDITTVAIDSQNPNEPITSVAAKELVETHVYDKYGNEVETHDRADSSVPANQHAITFSYYDAHNRKIAVVDTLGYMIAWKYDSVGNQIEQRVYTQKLNLAKVTSATLPAAPAGEVYVTNREYDAASRLTKEIAPAIDVFDPEISDPNNKTSVRPTTIYTYDLAGNQITKTIGAGTAQEFTTFTAYDDNNLKRFTLDSNRMLSKFTYSSTGNLLSQIRYFSRISASKTLTSDYDTLKTYAPGGFTSRDEAKSFVYDKLNRLTSQTDQMNIMGGSADNLVLRFKYDLVGNRTATTDENGNTTETLYDGVNQIIQTNLADGTGTVFEYDAVGNMVHAYTGKTENVAKAVQDTSISVRLGKQLNISWQVDASTQNSWVVYDSESRADTSMLTNPTTAYASSTTHQTITSSEARADLNVPTVGSALYYRIVTQDAAGNLAWTSEKRVTVPPRFTSVSVTPTGPNSADILVSFDSSISAASIIPANLPNSALDPLGSNTYKARLINIPDLGKLTFAVQWSAGGITYQSNSTSVTQADDVNGIGINTNIKTLDNKINITTALSQDYVTKNHVETLQAKLNVVGSDSIISIAAISGISISPSTSQFKLTLGDGVSLLANTKYQITLSTIASDGSEKFIDSFNYTLDTTTTQVRQTEVWREPLASGNDQIVIVNEQVAKSARQSGQIVVEDPSALLTGDNTFKAYYGTRVSDQHTFAITPNKSGNNIVSVNLVLTLSTNENKNVKPGSMTIRRNISGTNTWQEFLFPSPATPGVYSDIYTTLINGTPDVEIFYTDLTTGRKVIVERNRLSIASNPNPTFTSKSLMVLAQDEGKISFGGGVNAITVTPTLHSGQINVAPMLGSLNLTQTATANSKPNTKNLDGQLNGYFVNYIYNALNQKIESTEKDGLRRVHGVNEIGVIVQTDVHSSDDSYKRGMSTFNIVDARGRVLKQFSAADEYNNDLRGVTTYSYDVMDHVVTQLAPDNAHQWQYTYNALGTLIQTIDPLNNVLDSSGKVHSGVTKTYVDQFGHVTGTLSASKNLNRKFYDIRGNLLKEEDAEGVITTYGYDSFGRMIRKTDGRGYWLANDTDNSETVLQERKELGIVYTDTANGHTAGEGKKTADLSDADKSFLLSAHSTTYEYDNRDRITKVREAEGWNLANSNGNIYVLERALLGFNVSVADLSSTQKNSLKDLYTTTYEYDKKNNRIAIKSGSQSSYQAFVYDELDRVIDKQFVDQDLASLAARAGVVGLGGKNMFYDGAVHELTKYDQYGNIISQTNANGYTKTFEYDVNGRLIRSTDEEGNEASSTDQNASVIEYKYDGYNRLFSQISTDSKKNITQTYDQLNRIHQISDNITRILTNYTYNFSGQRVTEKISALGGKNPFVNNGGYTPLRDQLYQYNELGQLIRWANTIPDSTTIKINNRVNANLNYQYDSDGNRIRVFSDDKSTDHVYQFYAAGRLKEEKDNSLVNGTSAKKLVAAYTYDAAGNRATFKDAESAGDGWAYIYNANNRVVYAKSINSETKYLQSWVYDVRGNVLRFDNGRYDKVLVDLKFEDKYKSINSTEKTYDSRDRTLSITARKDGLLDQITTLGYDEAGHTTQMKVDQYTSFMQSGSTQPTEMKKSSYTYNYDYYGDGREKSVKATGSAKGSSTTEYDGNHYKKLVDHGQGSGQNESAADRFIYDSEGHILYKDSRDGVMEHSHEIRDYFYANGNSIGEMGWAYANKNNSTDYKFTSTFDSDAYSLYQNISGEYPGVNANYVTREGDSLQSIANAFYGDSSLWYILADANALSGNDALKAGIALKIPNVSLMQRMTATTHAIYNEGNIVGSTLPSLIAPPPKQDKDCPIVAIIIVVVVAALVSVVTAGAGAALAGLAVAAASASGMGAVALSAAVVAGVGAVAAGAGSVLRQELMIHAGYADDFEWGWSGVAGDALAGGLSGAAQGAGQGAQILAKAGKLTSGVANAAKYGSAGLKALSVVVPVGIRELSNNESFHLSWSDVAATTTSAVGGYLDASSSIAKGNEAHFMDLAQNATTQEALNDIGHDVFLAQRVGSAISTASFVNQALSPVISTAMSYLDTHNRFDIRDWLTPVAQGLGSTTSFVMPGNNVGRLAASGTRFATSAAINMIAYELDGKRSEYTQNIYSSVGNEVSGYISGEIVNAITPQTQYARVYDPEGHQFVDSDTGRVVNLPSSYLEDLHQQSIDNFFADLGQQQHQEEFFGRLNDQQHSVLFDQESMSDARDQAIYDYFGQLAAQQHGMKTHIISEGDTVTSLVTNGESLSQAEINNRVRKFSAINNFRDLNNIPAGTAVNLVENWNDSSIQYTTESDSVFFASAKADLERRSRIPEITITGSASDSANPYSVSESLEAQYSNLSPDEAYQLESYLSDQYRENEPLKLSAESMAYLSRIPVDRNFLGMANGDEATIENVYRYQNNMFRQKDYEADLLKPVSPWVYRTMGSLEALGAAAEFTAGEALTDTGIGAIAGVPMMFHGADHMQSGVRAAIWGQHVDSLTSQGFQEMGATPLEAGLLDAGVGLAFGYGGAKLPALAQEFQYTLSSLQTPTAYSFYNTVDDINRVNGALFIKLESGTLDLSEVPLISKGIRPLPNEYLGADYINNTLSQFDDGATRFMVRGNLDKYGPGQRDNTAFVMPASQVDSLLASANGDMNAVEDALGLPKNFLSDNKVVRVDFPKPKELNLRLPSGNEAGANKYWLAGGRLPTGLYEAVIDASKGMPRSSYVVNPFTMPAPK